MDYMNGKVIGASRECGRTCIYFDNNRNVFLMSPEEFKEFLADPTGMSNKKRIWDKRKKEMVKIEDADHEK